MTVLLFNNLYFWGREILHGMSFAFIFIASLQGMFIAFDVLKLYFLYPPEKGCCGYVLGNARKV